VGLLGGDSLTGFAAFCGSEGYWNLVPKLM
jgi:hypothetical protein